MVACAVILAVLVWALATGRFAAPDPRNVDMSNVLQRGAVGFVQKPYRVADLSRVVAQALAT